MRGSVHESICLLDPVDNRAERIDFVARRVVS